MTESGTGGETVKVENETLTHWVTDWLAQSLLSQWLTSHTDTVTDWVTQGQKVELETRCESRPEYTHSHCSVVYID